MSSLQNVVYCNTQSKNKCKSCIHVPDRDPKHSEAEEAACKAGVGLGFCKREVRNNCNF